MYKGILIAGGARSGTSALAGALGVCGVELGTSHVPANQHNKKGFCELGEVLALHDRCLVSLGASWDSLNPLPFNWRKSVAAEAARQQIRAVVTKEFAGKDLWAVKDSRLNRLAPLWEDELSSENLRAIVPLRHPFEVAHSLAEFNGKKWTESLLYWLFNLFESERATRGMQRVQTTYSELLLDSVGLIARLERELALTFPVPAEHRLAKLGAWVDPCLYRSGQQHKHPAEPGLDALMELTDSVYSEFLTGNVFADPEKADVLYEQCFGVAFFSREMMMMGRLKALEVEKHKSYAEMRAMHEERELLRLRLTSAEAWLKGPWLRKAFHRWNDPAYPRESRFILTRLTKFLRTKAQSRPRKVTTRETSQIKLDPTKAMESR